VNKFLQVRQYDKNSLREHISAGRYNVLLNAEIQI